MKTPFRDLSVFPFSVTPPCALRMKQPTCLSHSVAKQTFQDFFSLSPVQLFPAMAGNEAGSDLRKSWISSSVSKSLCGALLNSPASKAGLSIHFKDA